MLRNNMQVVKNDMAPDMGVLMEKVILNNDVSGLSSIEKVQYIKNLCESMGLNILTKPIQILEKFVKGKKEENLYFTKNATDQIRKLNNVSIISMDTKLHNGGLYVVTATARLINGREDTSTGTVCISGLSGENLANAMLKAETKAKRRATLSICGLGFMSEEEAESIQNAVKVPFPDISKSFPVEEAKKELPQQEYVKNEIDVEECILELTQSVSLKELQEIFVKYYKVFAEERNGEALRKIIEVKDKKKNELEIAEFQNELVNEEEEITVMNDGEIK